MDAVAVAMIMPGPVVITSGFIGDLVTGPIVLCRGSGRISAAVSVRDLRRAVLSSLATNPQVKALVQGVRLQQWESSPVAQSF
jgi:hypothetical protein